MTAIKEFFWRFDFGFSLRNWTVGLSWNDDMITLACGPVGLMFNLE